MQGEKNATPGLTPHTGCDASLSPHLSGPTELTREENAEIWEVWSPRPTSCRRAGSRSQYSSAQRGGQGTSWKQPASCPRGQAEGQAVINSGPLPSSWCDILAGKVGPDSAFSPTSAHLAFIDPDQGIGCWEGCFMMMIIPNQLIYWHVTYTQKEKL